MARSIRGAALGLLFAALLLEGLALSPRLLLAQAQVRTMGRITGRVISQETGQPVQRAEVHVAGTSLQALTDLNGRYFVPNVPPGAQNIEVRQVGFTFKTVTNVLITEDETTVLDVALSSATFAVEAITVTAQVERGTVARALEEQRTALNIVNALSAEQIAKTPDADAAEAVRRVSGVTVQDDKYVFVRGLGERYTTTSLNGARLPSPEPEKRVVPLDLFPSSLLESISTSKTFTPDQPGDFSGAEVNLRTRTFPVNHLLQFSLSGGYNSLVTGRDVPAPPTTGREWLAMAAGQRQLPTQLTGITDFSQLTQNDINALIRTLPRRWTVDQGSGPPNVSGSLSFGGEDPVLGLHLGYVGSLSYSRSEQLRKGEIRARAVPRDSTGVPAPYNTFTGSTGQSSVLWGGLLNLSALIGHATKIELNNTYDRTADNSAHQDWGTLEEFQQVDSVRRTQLQYVERSVRSNQLRATHQLGAHNLLMWSVTSSGVTRAEPDRADLAYGYELSATGERLPLAWLGFIPEAAKRTSSQLAEDALGGDLDYALSVGSPERPVTFKVGGAYRHTKRDAHSVSYNVRALGLGAAARAAGPDSLFYGAFTNPDSARVTLEPNNSGGTYQARDRVSAGYLMAEIPLGGRLTIMGGARLERWALDMDAEPVSRGTVAITRRNTDVLPSLAVNAKLSRDQTLRLSATQSLARPEYRELAPVSYRDMVGEREVFGDSSLVRTLVQNYDARWEWYPNPNEVVSVAVFAKRFDHPIEQIDVATSGASQLSFINAESAVNYGIELELRKGLGFLGLWPLALFSNGTLMRSRINTSNSNLSALTNDQRPMVGQAPYVVNAGLSYESLSGATSATLLYNVVGPRITSAAVTPLTVDTYERPRHVLDFSFRFAVYGGMTAKLDAKNLLDAAYEERQGDVIRYRYTTGRSFSLGVNWRLQ